MMKPQKPTRRVRAGEEGYALVLIMFFLALLVLSTVVAAPTVISSIQREREAEMVWRGKQYTRGIRMYYMKMRRFPTSLDDLTTAKNNIRFMRKAYKDPMNSEDGSWRLVYVGPNGQLIGSLNSQFLGTFSAMGGAPNSVAGMGMAQNTGFGGSTSSFGTSPSSTSFGNSGFGGNAAGGAASQNQAQGSGTGDASSTDPNAQNGDTSDQPGQPHSLNNNMDASNTIGGNIIGVGSKVNKKSFMWYQKAKDYRHFEFIWDPSKDMGIGGASRGIGTPVQNMNGSPGMNAPTGMQPNPQQQNQPQNLNPGGNSNVPLQAPPNQ